MNQVMTAEEKYTRDHELVSGTFRDKYRDYPVIIKYYKYPEDGIYNYCYSNGDHVVIERMIAEELDSKDMFVYDKHQDPTRYSKIELK